MSPLVHLQIIGPDCLLDLENHVVDEVEEGHRRQVNLGLSCNKFLHLAVKWVTVLILSILAADFHSSVKNFDGEIKLHQILEDAKDNKLATGNTTDQELKQYVQFPWVSELLQK